ncbi:MAG: type II secretion system protein J [Hyphomicrobium sp.]|uniref:PulJ/GspJ family protein n=1 Tax=Hyphomicrobium sp. TaxID=82 RepID=UPI003D0E4A6C
MSTSDAGYSLIEVLVALVISALLMAFAYRGLALGTRGLRVSNVEANMLEVAMEELAKAGLETPLVEGEHTGKTGNIDWTLIVTPYATPSDAAGEFGRARAYWVEIETRAEGRPARRLTTLKLDGELNEP